MSDQQNNIYHTIRIQNTDVTLPSRYIPGSLLGHGAQGTCFRVKDTFNNKDVCIKKMTRPLQDSTSAKRAFREIKLLRSVNHPNIIKLLDLFSPQEKLDDFQEVYLVMELMDGDLSRVTKTNLDHRRISFLIYQLLCGLKYLHDAGIIHRDLKPTNIVVDTHCRLKITDFGLARKTKLSSAMTGYVVTRPYRSPEVILEMQYESNVDVWSVGCILAELFLKEPLFFGSDNLDQWDKIVETFGTPDKYIEQIPNENVKNYVKSRPRCPGRPFEELIPDEVFPEDDPEYDVFNKNNARDLLSKTLVIDPKDRLTVSEALDHSYIKQWYKKEDVESGDCMPQEEEYNDHIDLGEWKRMIFEEVKNFRNYACNNY